MVREGFLQAWTQLSTQAYTEDSLPELCYRMVPTRTQLSERTVSNPRLDTILLFVVIQDFTVLKKACADHFSHSCLYQSQIRVASSQLGRRNRSAANAAGQRSRRGMCMLSEICAVKPSGFFFYSQLLINVPFALLFVIHSHNVEKARFRRSAKSKMLPASR